MVPGPGLPVGEDDGSGLTAFQAEVARLFSVRRGNGVPTITGKLTTAVSPAHRADKQQRSPVY